MGRYHLWPNICRHGLAYYYWATISFPTTSPTHNRRTCWDPFPLSFLKVLTFKPFVDFVSPIFWYFERKNFLTFFFHSLTCRDPSPWWHVAHISIQSNSIRIPPRGHVVRSPIWTPSMRSTRHSRISHPDDSISYPDMLSSSLTRVGTPCYVIPTVWHSSRSAACRVKGQEWWQVASHDLWQPPVGWWWHCHYLEASWRAKKSPHH